MRVMLDTELEERGQRLDYQGSVKHKRRPGQGQKGTLCPEWTHDTPEGGLEKVAGHPWPSTKAQDLLNKSLPCPSGARKRYATEKGIAFVARETRDGTWHGYPVPWGDVPDALKAQWQDEGLVQKSHLRRYSDKLRDNIEWAMETDDG